MLDCNIVKRRIRAGDDLDEPEVREHIGDCKACRELVESTGEPPGRDAGPTLDFDAVEAEMANETGVGARLREAKQSVRTALLVVLATIIAAVVFAAVPRADLSVYPTMRLWGIAAGLLIAAGGAATIGLRPLYKAPLSKPLQRVLLFVVTAAPFVVASLPPAHEAAGVSSVGAGSDFWLYTLQCFGAGAAMALPVVALGLFALRTRKPFLSQAMFIAAAAGAAGNLGLHLHCPVIDQGHLVLGHATVSLVYVALAGLSIWGFSSKFSDGM